MIPIWWLGTVALVGAAIWYGMRQHRHSHLQRLFRGDELLEVVAESGFDLVRVETTADMYGLIITATWRGSYQTRKKAP